VAGAAAKIIASSDLRKASWYERCSGALRIFTMTWDRTLSVVITDSGPEDLKNYTIQDIGAEKTPVDD